MNENLLQVTKYWILKDRLPYTLNQSTQARRSNYSLHPNTTNEKHNSTCCMPTDQKCTTNGKSESASRYVQAWETIKVKQVKTRTAPAPPMYSTCHAMVQHKCCNAASVCIVVQYHDGAGWLTGVEHQYLHTSSFGAVQCEWHSIVLFNAVS